MDIEDFALSSVQIKLEQGFWTFSREPFLLVARRLLGGQCISQCFLLVFLLTAMEPSIVTQSLSYVLVAARNLALSKLLTGAASQAYEGLRALAKMYFQLEDSALDEGSVDEIQGRLDRQLTPEAGVGISSDSVALLLKAIEGLAGQLEELPPDVLARVSEQRQGKLEAGSDANSGQAATLTIQRVKEAKFKVTSLLGQDVPGMGSAAALEAESVVFEIEQMGGASHRPKKK